jgi:hypothetical protein
LSGFKLILCQTKSLLIGPELVVELLDLKGFLLRLLLGGNEVFGDFVVLLLDVLDLLFEVLIIGL